MFFFFYFTGFLIDFVSGPVSSGFTSAVALIIVSSQIKDILGINAKGTTFVKILQSISSSLHKTSIWDAVLGIVCIIVLLVLRKVASVKIGPSQEERRTTLHRVLTNLVWLFGTSRNAIIVVICGVIGYNYGTKDADSPIKLIGEFY